MNELILAWVKMMAQKNRAKIGTSEDDLKELHDLLWKEMDGAARIPKPFPDVIFNKYWSDSWNKKRTELSPEKFKTPEDYYLLYALHFRAAMSEALTQTLYEVQSQAKEKQPEQSDPYLSQLSEREREVYRLVTEGQDRQGIADDLKLTASAIDAHIQHISEKLGLKPTKSAKKLREWLKN